jgi:hypothetical protein
MKNGFSFSGLSLRGEFQRKFGLGDGGKREKCGWSNVTNFDREIDLAREKVSQDFELFLMREVWGLEKLSLLRLLKSLWENRSRSRSCKRNLFNLFQKIEKNC